MNEIDLGSVDEYIRLFDREPNDLNKKINYFSVELVKRGLSCKAKIYSYEGDGVIAFFDDIAKNWKGWTGEKNWGSTETQFTISATHNNIGRVNLDIFITPSVGNNTWSVEGPISLDLGSLDTVAKNISKFIGKT